MGYSSSYHAASLAAVFLALAVGILIGVGLGDNLVSGTERRLSDSLENDINDARARADDLGAELSLEQQFSARAAPALVGDRLAGRRIGVLAFGALSPELTADIEGAVESAGAELAEVSVVRIPPDLSGLTGGGEGRRANQAQLDRLAEFGPKLGRQFVAGRGAQFERLRDSLFVRSSGQGGRLSGVVLALGSADDVDSSADPATTALIAALVSGVQDTGVPAVAVEREDTSPSTVAYFSGLNLSTVDDADSRIGRVSLVFALLGANGDFGVKDTADSLLPDLLVPRGPGGAG